MDFITKAKQTAGIMSLMLGAGFAPLSLSGDEEITTPSDEKSAILLQGLYDYDKWDTVLVKRPKEERIRRWNEYKEKHPEIYDYINALPEMYRSIVLHNEKNYIPSLTFNQVYLFFSDMLRVSFYNHRMVVFPLSFKAVNKWLVLPQKGTQNPARRGQPYVSVSDSALNKLSAAQKQYLLALQEVINENIHYLGNTPVPDWEAFRQEKGGAFFAPTLVRPETFYEAAGQPQKDMNKTHDELVTLFADGNAVKYQIQERVGTPLYNPHKVCPNLIWKLEYLKDIPDICFTTEGPQYAMPLGVQLFIGGGVEATLKYYPSLYYEKAQQSSEAMQQSLKAELGRIDPKSPLYPLVKSLVSQADRHLKEIDRTLDKVTRGKLEDVWTFLDPKGKYKPKELKEQERDAQRAEKKTRKKEEAENKAAEPQLIYRKKSNRRRQSADERQKTRTFPASRRAEKRGTRETARVLAAFV